MRRFSSIVSLLALLLASGQAAMAADPLAASPAMLGLDQARLERFDPLIEDRIASDQIPGAVLVIARRDKIAYFKSFGLQDKSAGTKMAKDAIFRIYSMSKPIVAAAAMMLYEEGKFDLRDPVSQYIPEFAAMKVGVSATDPKTGKPIVTLEPAARQITILDLLRHTSGLGYYYATDAAGQPYYHPYGVDRVDVTLAEWVKLLAAAPLLHQPGTTFEYSYGLDVIGRLIEIWSGKPLDVFLADRIFKPLGMPDTGFYVPEEKLGRLAVLYTPHPLGTYDAEGILGLGGPVVPFPGPQQDYFKHKPLLLSGGGGLVSTALDYAKFSMMLANGGAFNGVRLLSPKTVDLIGADVLGDRPRAGGAPFPGYGFGLTMEVSGGPAATGTISSKGEYDWGGVGGTSMFIDPQEKLVGVLMMQVIPASPYWGRMLRQVGTQAIVEVEK
jgi:CubicO group peptidase (beta-lactamase class C family)